MYRALSAARRPSTHRPWLETFLQPASVARCYTSSAVPFVENDIVILRSSSDNSASPVLTRPLAAHNTISTHKGSLKHSDIIGKLPRDVVTTNTGAEYRIHTVSLAEYALLSKRLVTPIYPPDANLIVSLFDLHVSPPSSTDEAISLPPIEILEAGTGHGALTLHLSRAIHAANPPKPALQPTTSGLLVSDEPDVDLIDGSPTDSSATTTHQDPLSQWKATRNAILHTIDVSPKFSKHARKVVRGFRHGLYADNVDFHVGDVSEWVKQQVTQRSQASAPASPATLSADLTFLTHAFLDLPATHSHIATVASALHTDGILMVFNPSITQIAECVEKAKRESLPLWLDQVIELGQNGTSGGREWDVRVVRPRADIRKDEEQDGIHSDAHDVSRDMEQASKDARSQKWSLVCRPKVGDRISGGGFIGIFRKMKDRIKES